MVRVNCFSAILANAVSAAEAVGMHEDIFFSPILAHLGVTFSYSDHLVFGLLVACRLTQAIVHEARRVDAWYVVRGVVGRRSAATCLF